MSVCPQCFKEIDLAFDVPVMDDRGRALHPACQGKAGRQGKTASPRSTNEVSRKLMWSALLPFYGIVYAIIAFSRSQVGPGLAFFLAGVVSTAVWFVVLWSLDGAAGWIAILAAVTVGLLAEYLIWKRHA